MTITIKEITMTIPYNHGLAEIDISDVSQDEDLLIKTKTGEFKITSTGEVFFYNRTQVGEIIHSHGKRR
jgi:hypothetical protein